jgi:Methyltransferase domain
MLGAAAGAIQDSRVQWIRARAEGVDQHLAQVDAAICNSAIWQTDLAATAAAVRRVLPPGGRFVFNVGSGFLDESDDPNELGDLPAVMRAIAARDYGWAPTVTAVPVTRARRRQGRAVGGLCGHGVGLDDTGMLPRRRAQRNSGVPGCPSSTTSLAGAYSAGASARWMCPSVNQCGGLAGLSSWNG